MATPVSVPFAPGVIERIAAGIRLIRTGDTSQYQGWFGPGTPPTPVAPEGTAGRQLDYAANLNTQTVPRQGEILSFATLRTMADSYDLMRLVIETKKDQLVRTEWKVRPWDKTKSPDDRCKRIQEFLLCPDQVNPWHTWFRASMEDLLVVDAWTILPRRKRNGEPYALELVDGTTIKPVLSLDGRRPSEGPVYQQILKGVVVGNFGPGEIYYLPQNVRSHKVYGYPRVEQVITTVNIAINRQISKLSYYTEGSTPDTIISAPAGWSMGQIKDFRNWWNDLLSGNSAERRKGLVVPNGSELHNIKDALLKDDFDDYLSRLICYAFSVSPSQLIKEQNRGKDQTQAEAAKAEGTLPILNFVGQQLTRIVCWDLFDAKDLEITAMTEDAIQPLVQAQIDDLDVKNTIRDVNECREGRGLQPLSPEELEARKPTPPPSPFGAPAAPGESPVDPKAAKPKAPEAPKPTEKLQKAWRPKTVLRRDRPSMLKAEAKAALGVSKRLHKLAKVLVPRLVEAYGQIDKATGDARALNVTGFMTKKDFEALGIFMQDSGLDVYEEGVIAAAKQLQDKANDEMVNLANEKGIDWALDHAAELIKDFEDATRNDLVEIVGQALQDGWSNQKLADALADAWSFSPDRAEVIARTETAFADVQGNVALYREAGVESLEWLAADTEPCDECEALDGKPVGLDGELPPLHPNCRCDVVPVLPETEE